MGPVEYSDFTASAAILYFLVIALGPATQTTTYFTARAAGEDAALAVTRTAQRVVLRYGTAVFLVALAMSPVAARLLRFESATPVAAVMASAYVAMIVAVRRGFLVGRSRFGAYSTSVVVESVLRLVAMFAAGYWAGTAEWGIATYGAAVLFILVLAPLPRGGQEQVDPRPLIRYFLPAFATTAVYSAFLNADILLVKLFFSADDAAVYGAASFLGRAPGMLVAPFSAFAVPFLVSALNDRRELRRRFFSVLLQYIVLAIGVVGAMAFFRRPLVLLLIGRDYAAAADYVVPIGIAVALGGLTFLLAHLPMSAGSFRFLKWYAAGFALEIAAVALWHDTRHDVILTVVAAQGLTLMVILFKVGREILRS